MSDKISSVGTALSMDMSELEMAKCTLYNLKMFGYILLVIILWCIISSLLTPIEPFFNDNTYSYKKIKNSKTAKAELLSPKDHLIGGLAHRYAIGDDKARFTVSANLYLLNGNVFGPLKEQSYVVILSHDATDEIFELGELQRDHDQVYKLDTTVSIDKLKYNRMNIFWKTKDSSNILVTGEFH